MDKTICGYERETLRVALARAANADQDPSKAASALAWVMVAERTGYAGPDLLAFNDVHDPAKLAEMLAHEGRRLGLSIAICDNHLRLRMSGARVVYALLIIAGGVSIMDRDKRGWDFDVPQARHILLQWLQLPDGARKEAERGLRGES